MDGLELKPGLREQALKLLGAPLIETPVVVIEGGEAAEAAIDLPRRPDGSHHMMTARPGRTIGTLQQLHRLHDDELVQPLLGQGEPAADEGAVVRLTGELTITLLVLQPRGDAGKGAHNRRGQPGDGVEPPQQPQDDLGDFAHGGPCLLSWEAIIAGLWGVLDKFLVVLQRRCLSRRACRVFFARLGRVYPRDKSSIREPGAPPSSFDGRSPPATCSG